MFNIVIFIIYFIVLIQLFLVLFAYGHMESFHKYINNISLKCLIYIKNIRIFRKFLMYSEDLYIFSINTLVAATILSIVNFDTYPIFAFVIYIISLLLYIIAFALKFDKENESFENNYLIEFLIATSVGLMFSCIINVYLSILEKESFNPFLFIFLLIFILYYYQFKKHNKTL